MRRRSANHGLNILFPAFHARIRYCETGADVPAWIRMSTRFARCGEQDRRAELFLIVARWEVMSTQRRSLTLAAVRNTIKTSRIFCPLSLARQFHEHYRPDTSGA
jgi:hypothetical protein